MPYASASRSFAMQKAGATRRNTGRDSAPSRKKSTNCRRRSQNRSTRNWRISSSAAATTRRSSLSRIQLDDELLVHHRLHLLARGNAGDFAFKGVPIDREPIGNGRDLGEIEIAQDQLTRFGSILDRDFITGFDVVGSD